MPNAEPELNFSEFFAGIGLVRMGLEAEGWSVSFANDNDPQKLEMYEAHFGSASSYYRTDDIRRLHGEDVPDVQLATASFPCNDLSLAGPRAGLSGQNSSMFWEFARIIGEMGERRPPMILLENVYGFLKARSGADLVEALQRLNELEYAVDVLQIDASHFVPQSRVRLFIIGTPRRAGPLTSTKEEQLCFGQNSARSAELADFILRHPELDWRLRELPSLPRSTHTLGLLLEDLGDTAPEWWDQERASKLLSQMSAGHRAKAEEMIRTPRISYGTVFRRMRNDRSMAELRTDGVAGCLRTPRGGSARQILFVAGHDRYQVRLLTPRENARLMGADDYVIRTTLNKALFGFGDAVCVPVIRWLARNYLNPAAHELASRPTALYA